MHNQRDLNNEGGRYAVGRGVGERERERERAFNGDERNEEGGEGFFHQASFDLCVLGAYDER